MSQNARKFDRFNRSELAFAESQILEIQKELDAHKQECYGHMKVIQEMRFGKMQASQIQQGSDLQKCAKQCGLGCMSFYTHATCNLEPIFQHLSATHSTSDMQFQVESSMRTIKSSSTQQILDLQLELVKTKRALAKSEAEGCKVAEEKKELVLEHDRARAEFGIILANCETSKKVGHHPTRIVVPLELALNSLS